MVLKGSCIHNNRANCSACESDWRDEMAFVQLYEVMEKCTVPNDEIDDVLQWVRLRWQKLRWQKTTGLYEKHSSAKHSLAAKNGVVSLDSTRAFCNPI